MPVDPSPAPIVMLPPVGPPGPWPPTLGDPDAGVPIPTQRQRLRCGDARCRAMFEADTPIRCDVGLAAHVLRSLRCPRCGSDRVMAGQARSLAEDEAFPRGPTYQDRVSAWAANGEVGASSRSIYRRMLGQPDPEPATPSDPSDVLRCVLLLRRVPEWRARMGEMADASRDWAHFARGWDDLEAAFVAEGGLDGCRVDMPRTRAVLSVLAPDPGLR